MTRIQVDKIRRRSRWSERTILLLVIWGMIGLSFGGMAQTVDDDWRIERLSESVPLAENTTVEIRNPHGDLRVRAASDGQVAVSAIVQRHRDDSDRPEITFEGDAGRLKVIVRYHQDEPPSDPAMKERRVDVTAFVPESASLVLVTDGGLLNVRTGSDLELETVSGTIDVKTAGRLRVTTDRGAVLAVLQASTWSASNEVRSSTGDIELWLARDAGVSADVETGGWFTTDFSAQVEHDDAVARKRIKARIGAGGGPLQVRSTNGAVRLFRSP